MDPAKVAQTVEVLNGLTVRDAFCLLVACMLTLETLYQSSLRTMETTYNRVAVLSVWTIAGHLWGRFHGRLDLTANLVLQPYSTCPEGCEAEHCRASG
jgi:hypothetical protein